MLQGRSKTLIIWLGLLTLAFLVFWLITPGDQSQPIPISEVISHIEQGKVKQLVFIGPEVKVTYTDGKEAKSYTTDRELLMAALDAHKEVKYDEKPVPNNDNSWLYLLLKFGLPIILIFFIFRMLANRQQGQAKMFAGNKAVKHEKSTTKFADVAGCDEAVEEVRDLVDFLKGPERFSSLGARIPKGVMLVGPPGTGKTLLARAVAGEAGVPFFSISGSEFVEMYVGVGAGRVRALFEDARKHAPCIVFVDEFDGVGRQRGSSNGNSNDEREQTLNQILKEMDGFEGNTGIIVLAATNRPDIIDAAVMRAGRFDRKVVLSLPDVKGRETILGVHARNKTFEADVELRRIAQDTIGMSGADLEQMLNEAALAAVKRGSATVSQQDIQLATDKVLFGAERKSAVVTPRHKRIVAAHESGHAVVSWFLPQHDAPRKVSIVPRGQAGGVTIYRPEQEQYLPTRSQFVARLASGLGGRAAERLTQPLVDGEPDVTAGASSDLAYVTQLAYAMVTQLGMGDSVRTFGARNLGSLYEYGPTSVARDFSEKAAEDIDIAVQKLLDEASARADDILKQHRSGFDAMVALLLERETIELPEIEAMLGPRPPKPL